MKAILSSRRRHYLARVSIFLITLALIAGMVGCGEPAYNLTIASTTGGKVTTPGEGTFTYYAQGVIVLVVALVAEADEGYRFVNWTGDVGTIGNVSTTSTNITVQGDYSITANFLAVYDLTISSTAGGNVTAPGEAGPYTYDEGTVVDLVAVPEEGYSFVNWTGDVGSIGNVTAATTTITINDNYAITANFAIPIWDWYDLHAIRDNLSGSYLLMNDLDSDTDGYAELASEIANSGSGWNPLNSFRGTFDGQGYEINDLFINRPTQDYRGLFSVVNPGGVIENVGVNGNVTGHDYVGGLVGMNKADGNVTNCYATGMVTGAHWAGGLVGRIEIGGQVIDSYSTGCVTSSNTAGGLIGWNYGTVNNCYSSGNVTGQYNAGGLMGINSGTVSNSYSTGSVTGSNNGAGGLVGQNIGTMNNCYSSGNVTGYYNAGGLIGINSGTVNNSFWDKDTSGQAGSPGGIGKTTLEMMDFDTFDGAGWDIVAVANAGTRDTDYIWNIVDDVTYPFLSWQPV